jgi:hypothetical protein
VAQLDAHLVVEIGHRLVEQQQRRVDRQRTAERDALPLSARQLRDGARAEALHLQQRQHFVDAAGDLVLAGTAHLEPVADVAGNGHVRPERVRLEHHRRAALFGR